MKTQAFILSIALAASGAIAADTPATKSATTGAQKADLKPQMSAEEQALMARWTKARTPGAPHQTLTALAGKWKYTSKVWMDPSKPPEISEGKSVKTMILGDRYLQEQATGTVMGQPFEGTGTTGFDNVKGKYVGTWLDNLGTAIMYSSGEADPSGKVVTMKSEVWDPMHDKVVKVRYVTTIQGPDKHLFEWYGPGLDGKEVKTMELAYERIK